MLAQTFGKAFQQDLGKHAAGTNVSRKSLRWDWRLEANLNRKANGLALEGPSVGLYVPLLEFNQLVKKHLGKIGEAENAFKSASALLEKHKTKYPELEQYIEHVSASDRSIQILEDIKDPRRAHYIFNILLTGVEPAYQAAHPGEKDHTNVDRAAWISTFEEALAKAIVQIVLSRQAEQASQAVGSPKE